MESPPCCQRERNYQTAIREDAKLPQFERSVAYDMKALEAWYDSHVAHTWGIWEFPRTWPDVLPLLENELDDEMIERDIRHAMTSIEIANGVCRQCQMILDHWPATTDFQEEMNEVSSGMILAKLPRRDSTPFVRLLPRNSRILEAGFRKGCRMCTVIIISLRQSDNLDRLRMIEQRWQYLGGAPGLSIMVCYHVGQSSFALCLPGKPGMRWSGFIWVARCESIENNPALRTLSVKPQITDSLELARRWLKECCKEHDGCRPVLKLPLPSRLLDITADLPRLIVTSDCNWVRDRRPRYATLSHCWGDEPFFCLTATNMRELITEGIRPIDLTQTFRDAIKIARAMGLDYLWIDSLCIIQSDHEDWAKEAVCMSSVYQGSTVNIAASSARHGGQGCFLKPILFCEGFHAELTIGSRSFFRRFQDTGISPYFEAVEKSHLTTRAWCFQETLLAPRMLYCGDRGLWWVCPTKHASESFPSAYWVHSGSVSEVWSSDAPWHGLQDWMNIVCAYSKGDLTFGQDKLVAIAGIAQIGRGTNSHQYLAGMWRPWLDTLLLWYVHHEPRPEPLMYRAPSWSWASVDGQVTYDFNIQEKQPVSHVLDASVTAAGADPFGAVQDGWVKLCCPQLVAMMLCRNEETGDFHIELGQSSSMFPVCMDSIGPLDPASIAVVALPLSRTSRSYHCLILRPTGDSKGEYIRIGYFPVLRPFSASSETPELDITPRSTLGVPHSRVGDLLYNIFEERDLPPELYDELKPEIHMLASDEISEKFPGAPYVITIV